jgi:hypothetical protein
MKTLLRILTLPLFLAFFSCKDDGGPVKPENGSGGRILTGSAVEVGTLSVPASGGTVRISKPSDPIDGFEITVPAGGFDESQQFIVSRAEITSHELGSHFSPISPMIRISYGGGYSETPMTVKVPVRVPDGHFAMGFFYDEAAEKLEPIPVQDLDSVSVTLSTRHLSPAGASLQKGLFRGSGNAIGNMVIASIQTSFLDNQATLTSGFEPGRDDWEFPNFGSYVAPGGHCAGQSMTAMWYYYEKRLAGEPALNHRYDTVNDPADANAHWVDNPRGYRFSSTIQEDQNFDRWIESLDFQTQRTHLSWYAFIFAMLMTGEPQYVLIRNSATGAGHAMIVYKIIPSTGTLCIADPNFPNNKTRVIEYRNGALLPYSSALIAGGPGTVFDQIGYAAKTTHIEWPKISERWAEFQNGTIGNDRFPGYTLWARNAPGAELIDTLSTYADTLKVHCRSLDTPIYLADTDHLQVFEAYDGEGTYLGKGGSSNKGILAIPLKMGDNRIGFYVKGFEDEQTLEYVDFRWTNVKRLRNDIDFTRVRHVTIGILVVNTEWKDYKDETRRFAMSPVAGADVTLNGGVLSGKNPSTGDSVSVTASPSAPAFFARCRTSLGSPGNGTVTFSGSIGSRPLIRTDNFRYEAAGEAAVGAVITNLTVQLGGSWTWLGYSFASNSSFGLTCSY